MTATVRIMLSLVLFLAVPTWAEKSRQSPTPAPEEKLVELSTTGPDGLTTDRSEWRMLRAGSPMYSDEDAYQKIRQYGTDNRNPIVRRMQHEQKFQKERRAIKVELLQEHGPHDMSKIRFFRRLEGRPMDMWAAEADIIPYNEDLWNKVRLEEENDEEVKNETLLYDRLKQYEGKIVPIREGGLLLSDEMFWEFAALLRRRDDALAIKKAAEWVHASLRQGTSILAMLVGEKSFGAVTSIHGPYLVFLRLESTLEDGRKGTFWVTTSDVRSESDASAPPVLHRFMKLESVKINGVSINAISHSAEIKKAAVNRLVKEAVLRAIANVEKTQSPAGIDSLIHPSPTVTHNVANSHKDETTLEPPSVTARPTTPRESALVDPEKKAAVGMPESEAAFWANALVTMVDSGELEMDCANGKARINPHTWAAGGRQAQERLACAIWLTCGIAGTKRVVIYDGQLGKKLAAYGEKGFQTY